MMKVLVRWLAGLMSGMAIVIPVWSADTGLLRPYILGNAVSGTPDQVVAGVKAALVKQGFTEVGSYSPYAGATVIVVTSPELKAAAASVRFGGFGAGQRVAITEVNGKSQVTYVNPAYLGAAYGLGSLEAVSARLKSALGADQDFGSEKGMSALDLAPGTYHYMTGMPYFHQVDHLATHGSYQAAVAAVESGLAAGKGGTRKVYRIDLPGKEVSVFGVAIVTGDGINKGAKDTDKEIMDIIDWKDPRSTAYLPYEVLVQGGEVLSLRGRYRIAVHFPDTTMMGAHGFTKIMSSPSGIKQALSAVAGGAVVGTR